VDILELNPKVNELLHVSKQEISGNVDLGNPILVSQSLVDSSHLSFRHSKDARADFFRLGTIQPRSILKRHFMPIAHSDLC
jgi:hypothetical protein